MTPDTINMILNIAAIVGWIFVAFLVWRSRAEIKAVQVAAEASKAALNGLPKAIAPAQAPVLEAISKLISEADRLTLLLGEEADQRDLLKKLIAEGVELRRINGTLEHKIGVRDGEMVQLNDIVHRQASVIAGQEGQINKLAVAVREQTAVTGRQQKLIEELIRAVPDGKASAGA